MFPDHAARAKAWAHEQTEATWEKMKPHYDDAARVAWLRQFEARMKSAHYDPLARFESDWRAAADDDASKSYFSQHFDPEDRNDPLQQHSPGRVYAAENYAINTPAPITTGKVLDTYLAMLDLPITEPSAVVQRALVGNQQSVIDMVYTQITGDPGADGMRDKTYDLLKGLRDKAGSLHKYSWIGDGLSMLSLGQASALSAAALSAAGRSDTISPRIAQQLGKIQHLWGVQQAVELVIAGALSGQAPKVPVLVTMKVDVDRALEVLRARKGQAMGVSRSSIKRLRGTGVQISLSLLTDTDQLRAAQGSLDALIATPQAGAVKMQGAAAASVAVAGGTAVLSEAQFLRLYAQQAALGGQSAQAVQRALVAAGADARAITMSLDGRLAIGSIVVQGIGLVNSLKSLRTETEQNKVRDAWYGLYDSTAGTLGGLLELWSVVVNTRVVAQAGPQAASASRGLGALRFLGNIAGAAGGLVNYVAGSAKSKDARAVGDVEVAALYRFSSYAFAGTTVTSALTATGVAAEIFATRGLGGAVARTIAIRLAGQGGAALLGVSITGWGLVLLGAGVMFQVAAIALTPTPLQRWIARSYFGRDDSLFSFDDKRDDMFEKGNWKVEFDALEEALREAGQK